jgi:Radical SAM superfamily
MKNIVIAIAPFTYTYGPSLAPALLKACLSAKGIKSVAWDLSAEFNHSYQDHEYYAKVINWMKYPEMNLTSDEFAWYSGIINEYANKLLHHYNVDILCLSLLTMSSIRFTEDLSYALKVANPNIKIIIGGNGLNIMQQQYNKKWYQLMLDTGLVDTVILREGELTLPDAIDRDLTGVIVSPQLSIEEFEQVPFPDYHDYDFSWYPKERRSYWSMHGIERDTTDVIFLVTSSKGCVKDCTFCSVTISWPKYRVRSGEKTADELIYLNKEFGAKYFNFTDSLMNGGLKPFNNMNLILAEKIPNTITYEGQFICRGERSMPERYFEAMAVAGCRHVSIGIESGDEGVREHMKKGSTDEDVHYSAEMLLKYGILQEWNIIAGYPTETDENWENTMKFVKYWVHRGKGKITFDPMSTYLLVDETPMMQPKMMEELQLKQTLMNGYSSFTWTSGVNKGNTFDVRAARFLEVCNYLIDFDPEVYTAQLSPKIAETNMLLEIYNSHEKKI